ncbi:DUF58 domain-containing protein [Nocardioides nanhaiensis]
MSRPMGGVGMLVGAVTGRGRATLVLGLALLVGGVVWRYPVLAALGACLVLLVVAELVSVLGGTGLRVQREVAPRVVERHGACHGRVRVHGRRRRGLVRLDAADLVAGRLVRVPLPGPGADAAPAGAERVSETYAIPTPRRGVLVVGPLQLRSYGLTGMAARSTTAGGTDLVRVLPRTVPIAGLVPGHRRAAAGGDDSLEHGGTDLVGLHEYAMGDDLRRLHWATSARTGLLMVREDAEPSEPHVCVVLDDRAPSYPDSAGAAEQFEEAVELAAGLCRATVDAGHPLRFRTASGRTEVVVPGSATRQPRAESQELDLLFAEIDTVPHDRAAELGTRDLDVVVVVTGAASDVRAWSLALDAADSRIVAAVETAPLVAVQQQQGLLVLRGGTAVSLAQLWERATGR